MAHDHPFGDAIGHVARQMVTVPPDEDALDRLLAALPEQRPSFARAVRFRELRRGLAPHVAVAAAAIVALVWVANLGRSGDRTEDTPQIRAEAPAQVSEPMAERRAERTALERTTAPLPAPTVQVDLVRERDLPPVSSPVELSVTALAPAALVVEPEEVAPLVVEELSVGQGR
jgi:hypothetical protein